MTLAVILVLRSVKGHCVKGSAYIQKITYTYILTTNRKLKQVKLIISCILTTTRDLPLILYIDTILVWSLNAMVTMGSKHHVWLFSNVMHFVEFCPYSHNSWDLKTWNVIRLYSLLKEVPPHIHNLGLVRWPCLWPWCWSHIKMTALCQETLSYWKIGYIWLCFHPLSWNWTIEITQFVLFNYHKRPSSNSLHSHNSGMINGCHGNQGIKMPCSAFFKILCILTILVYLI